MSTTSTSPAPVKPAGPPRELLLSTSFLLKRLGWTIKERAHEALEATGMSPQHHAVLSLLDERACGAQGTLADALGYDRSQMVGLLDELEDKHLIERKRDPDDRRRHVVKLTPAGKEALTKLRVVAKAVEKEFLAPLSAEERRTLHTLLQQLASYHDPRLGAKP
jgi:MarR family transcriptional regulator, lower aerobic nicotinate degradation pathway regulator